MNRGSADAFWAIVEGQDDRFRPGERDIVRVQRALPPAGSPAHRFYEVYQGSARLGSIFQETPRHQLVAVAHGRPAGSFPATTEGLERARRAVAAAPKPRAVEEAGPAPVAEMDLFWGRVAAPPPVPATRRNFLAAQAAKVAAKANQLAVESQTPDAHAAAAKANRAAAALQESADEKGRLLLKATQHAEAERVLRHKDAVLAAQQEQRRLESVYGFWAENTAHEKCPFGHHWNEAHQKCMPLGHVQRSSTDAHEASRAAKSSAPNRKLVAHHTASRLHAAAAKEAHDAGFTDAGNDHEKRAAAHGKQYQKLAAAVRGESAPRRQAPLAEDALADMRDNPPYVVKSTQYRDKYQVMIWSTAVHRFIPQGPPVSKDLADEDLIQTKKAHQQSIKTLQGRLMQKKKS